MSKWYGNIGFDVNEETKPGVWTNFVARPYFGDVIKSTVQNQISSDTVNGSIRIRNQISIVADPYAKDHIYDMRYIEFQGVKWCVTDVEVQSSPRLLISIGGVWNG